MENPILSFSLLGGKSLARINIINFLKFKRLNFCVRFDINTIKFLHLRFLFWQTYIKTAFLWYLFRWFCQDLRLADFNLSKAAKDLMDTNYIMTLIMKSWTNIILISPPPVIQSCSASIPFIDPFWGLEVAELKEDMPNFLPNLLQVITDVKLARIICCFI